MKTYKVLVTTRTTQGRDQHIVVTVIDFDGYYEATFAARAINTASAGNFNWVQSATCLFPPQ